VTFKRDIQSFSQALQDAVLKSASDQFLRVMGNTMVNIIVLRTREGYGMRITDGNRSRLKPLAPSTIAARRRKRLSSLTSASTSNLTETSAMLSSIKASVSRGKILIKPTGIRSDGKSNQSVANYVSDVRPFLTLGRAEFNKVVDIYETGLDASLKQSLSRLRR